MTLPTLSARRARLTELVTDSCSPILPGEQALASRTSLGGDVSETALDVAGEWDAGLPEGAACRPVHPPSPAGTPMTAVIADQGEFE